MSRELPDGWKAVKIGDVLSIRRGVTWEKDAELPPGNDDAMPVISIPNIQDRLDLAHLRYIRKTSVSNIEKFIARSGWTLMVGSNGNPNRVGNCVLAAGVDECLFASFLLGIYPTDTTDVLPEYSYRILSNQVVQDAISASVQGTTGLRNISVKMLRELEVSVPPLHEQCRIAEILSSIDAAIAATRAVIEQTRKVKQGVLERLLTKGIGHTRFKQTEIGEIPEGWKVVELDDITPPDRKITYGIVQAGPDYPEGVPYIRVSDMGEYQIDEGSVLRTSPEIAGKYTRSELRRDDIVFALRGKVGHVLRTPQSLVGANLTQGTARIACGNRAISEFLLWALRSPQSERQYKREIKGSTFQELTLGSLKRIRVPLPSLEEQRLLAHHIEDVQAGLRSSERSLSSLLEAKSALMSDLLTGRKRVTDALPMAAE